MSTELYYFSATGNTLYVAKELQKRLPNSRLIPIVSQLNLDRISIHAETIGIVFPLHGLTLPVPVTMFLRKLKPGGVQYIFAVTTRGGTINKGFSKMERLLARKGKMLDSCFTLDMFTNDPKLKVYEIPSADAFARMEERLQARLDQMKWIIINRQSSKDGELGGKTFPYSRPVNYLIERLVLLAMAFARVTRGNNYFYSNEKCKGCGTCEKVCLSKKIKLVDKRPVWQRTVKCYRCYACLNYCSKEAVQIRSKWYMKSFTQNNGRYPHPYARADEIALQKSFSSPSMVPSPHSGSAA
jgi:NAD-dependent dihydropyrimidine dehydrogenase PreA subunit